MDANNLNHDESKAPPEHLARIRANPHTYLDIAAGAKSNREIALKLAEFGFPVFPCWATPALGPQGQILKKAKRPHILEWPRRATTDLKIIEAWWKRWPDALPGLPCGELTGLWVLDTDAPTETRDDGLKGLAALTAEHGDLITYTITTPGGGFHFYFIWHKGLGNSTGTLPKGIDARGNGGYVIAPGSRLLDGCTWKIERDFAVAPIPGWLRGRVERIERFDSGTFEPSVGETAPGLRELARLCERPVSSQNSYQHKDLFWISAAAGNLVGAGDVLLATAEAHLLAAGLKMENFDPGVPWTETELKRQIRNGLKKGRQKPLQADRTNAEWWAEQLAIIEAFHKAYPDGLPDGGEAPPAVRVAEAAMRTKEGEAKVEAVEPPPSDDREQDAEKDEAEANPKKAKAKKKGPGGLSGFSITRNALWVLADDPDKPPMRVSQPFELLGRARGAPNARGETDSWGVLIRFRNHDEKERDAIVGYADLHADVGPLCGSLADKGMDIERSDSARKAFAIYLLKAGSEARVTLAPRVGWNIIGGRYVFVLPSGTIAGNSLTEHVILAASVTSVCEVRGTLEGWKTGVASLAEGNVLAVLAISTALGNPRLRLAGYESGGLNYYGTSSIGKTTLARLFASVWARGDETGGVRSWRATHNGLEGALAGASDVGLVVDELSQVDGEDLYRIIYMIAGGAGKTRMDRDTSLRPVLEWKLLMLSTGEFPIEVKLTEDSRRGRKSRAGQAVRFVDLKVDRKHGAFDDLKGMEAVALAEKCKREATTHYGVAGPAFVRALIDKGVTGETIRARVSAFTAEVLREARTAKTVSGQIERVAERLGVIAVAGELATEFGIVPWPAKRRKPRRKPWGFGSLAVGARSRSRKARR